MRDLTRLILPDVQDLLASDDPREVAAELLRLHSADIADLIEHLDPEKGARLFTALGPADRVEVIEYLDESFQVKLVEQVGRGPMIQVIEDMSPDDRADLVQAMSEQTRDAILPLLAQAERNEIKRLLSYPEDSAGSVMTTEYATVAADNSVRQALETLRRVAPSSESIYSIYVVEKDQRLVGVVSLRDLVLARPNQVVVDLMETDVIVARVNDDQEEVARAVEKYNFLAIPVVDEANRIVGMVTQDDVMDVIQEEATEDAQKMAGMEPLDSPYMHSGFWQLVQKRGIWLILLLVAGLCAGAILLYFGKMWEKLIILALFFPIIIASGGNSGAQSSVLVIRSMALGEIKTSDWLKVVLKEWLQGLALGLILGLILGMIGVVWGHYIVDANGSPAYSTSLCIRIGCAVAVSLMVVVTMGTLLGSALPLLFKKIGLDPAIMSTPSIAASMDVLGLLTFFLIIKAFLPPFYFQ